MKIVNSVFKSPTLSMRARVDRPEPLCGAHRLVDFFNAPVRAMLGLLVAWTVFWASPAVCQDYAVRFSFHRLAFEAGSQESYGHLLIIDNESKGRSYFLASNGERVFGFPPAEVDSSMEDWTGDPERDYRGCWDALAGSIRVENPDQSGDTVSLSEAVDSLDDNGQRWLTIFESLLNRAKEQDESGDIRDGDVKIEFDFEPAFSFTGWALCDSLAGELAKLDTQIAHTNRQSVFYIIRNGPWPLSVGVLLILYSALLFVNAAMWPWSGPGSSRTDEADRTDKIDRTAEADRATLSEKEPSWWQRYRERREEKHDRTRQLGELLDSTIRVLNQQHRLAAYYYVVVRSVAEIIASKPWREEETNPVALGRLKDIKEEIDSLRRRPFSRVHETVIIEPMPSGPGGGAGGTGQGPAEVDGSDRLGRTDSPTGQPGRETEAGPGKWIDKAVVKTGRKGDVGSRASSVPAFLRGIPDLPVRSFIKNIFDQMHGLIWKGRYLAAGREDWLMLRGKRKPDHPEGKAGGNDRVMSVPGHNLSRVWPDKPVNVELDDLGPQALLHAYQSYEALRVSVKESAESKAEHDAMKRGFQWFAASGWPLAVFRGISFAEFDGIAVSTQEKLERILTRLDIGAGSAELVGDLQFADIEHHLSDLDLQPETLNAIRVACKHTFDGPRLSELLSSVLKGFIRSCLKEAAHVNQASVEDGGFEASISKYLAIELTNTSVSFLTPVLKSGPMIDLVWDLARVRFPAEASGIGCALHPFRQSAIRATKKLKRLLEFARLVPAGMMFYMKAKRDYGIERFADGGRSVVLKELWRCFGEGAFKEVYTAKGLYDDDYDHVVDIYRWGAYRDNEVFADCKPVAYTFGNNPIKLGRTRPRGNEAVGIAGSSDDEPGGPADASEPERGTHHPDPMTDVDGKASGPDKRIPDLQPGRETSAEPRQDDLTPPPDTDIDSPPTASDKVSRAKSEAPSEQRPRNDDSELKGESFDDPTR